MGWYRFSSTVRFRRRAAITVDNSSGVAATSLDVDIAIPKDWDDFWGAIDSSGDNLRVTAADGVTLVSYDVDDGAGGAFDSSARAGRIRVDGMTIPTGTAGVFLLWVYFDPADSNGATTVADGSSAVVMASIASGYIDLDGPVGPWLTEYQPQIPRSTNPRDLRHKGPSEQVYVWFRLDRALAKHRVTSEGSKVREEPYYASMAVLNVSAADQTSMYDLGANRFVWHEGSRTMWLKCLVKAGTTDTRYTAAPTFHTCLPFAPTTIHKTHTPRMGLAVRQVIFES